MQIRQIFTQLRAGHDRRVALLRLHELDNHLLFDIGVTRDEIRAALQPTARRR